MHITKIHGAPGTGKTTKVLSILEDELRAGTPLDRICICTFSRAGAHEAQDRARAQLPGATQDQMRYFRTIHAMCFSEIGMSGPNIMKGEDYLDFGDWCPVQFSDNYTKEVDYDGLPFGWGNSPGNQVMNVRQVAANKMVNLFDKDFMLNEWPRDLSVPLVRRVNSRLDQFKSERGMFDFVDMLEIYIRSGAPLPIDVMIVDEAQDLSRLQWAVVNKMAAGVKRMYLAGDDDQSIYGFMGADQDAFYEHSYDEKLVLDRTYRLPSNIWSFARRIIERVKHREPKTITPNGEGGEVKWWGMDMEQVLDRIPLDNVMVIAATNWGLASLKAKLDRAGIPVSHKGACITQTPEAQRFYWFHSARKGKDVPMKPASDILKVLGIKDWKAVAEDARRNPDHVLSPADLTRLGVEFRVAPEYLANKKRHVAANERLTQIARNRGLEACVEPPRVTLTTYHASKGREAKRVIVSSDCSPAAMDYAMRNPDHERRVAYVGVTRAMQELHICRPQTDSYMKALING